MLSCFYEIKWFQKVLFTNTVLDYGEIKFIFNIVLPWPFLSAHLLLPNPFCNAGQRMTRQHLSRDAATIKNRLFCSHPLLRFPFSAGPVGTHWCELQRNRARSVLEYLVIFTSLQLHTKTKIFCKVLSLFIHKTFTFFFLFRKKTTVAHSMQAECWAQKLQEFITQIRLWWIIQNPKCAVPCNDRS